MVESAVRRSACTDTADHPPAKGVLDRKKLPA